MQPFSPVPALVRETKARVVCAMQLRADCHVCTLLRRAAAWSTACSVSVPEVIATKLVTVVEHVNLHMHAEFQFNSCNRSPDMASDRSHCLSIGYRRYAEIEKVQKFDSILCRSQCRQRHQTTHTRSASNLPHVCQISTR